MNRAKLPRILILFTLLVKLSSAYDYDDDDQPSCERDKCFAEIGTDVPLCWMEGDSQNMRYMHPMEGGFHSIPNACMRSNIFGSDGYLVAYPSTGGVVFLRNPLAVDLQHLKLPNTHDIARSSDEDDELATRMVQLGAQWWPTWDLYFRHSTRLDLRISYNHHFPSKVDVAFPTTGGVWVSNFTQDQPQYLDGGEMVPSWLPYPPNLWHVKMRYALTMDDKAEVMKNLGATFYSSVDEIPGLAKTVDEAVGLFEPFKRRLESMEDNAYRKKLHTVKDEDEETDIDQENEEPQKQRWGIGSLLYGYI